MENVKLFFSEISLPIFILFIFIIGGVFASIIMGIAKFSWERRFRKKRKELVG
jgi:uncharacterized integral membrane protein